MADPAGETVLLIAPTGQDVLNLSAVLEASGLRPSPCRTLSELAAGIDRGCGAVVLTEEALTGPEMPVLLAALGRQAPWSDLPIILLTGAQASMRPASVLSERGNINLLERPLRRATILAAVKSAMRARSRQYQVRDLIAERASLLNSLEERVTQRTAELRLMVEELETFSYSISHDLRAPLRAMILYGEALKEEFGPQLDLRAQDYINRIARASRRMDRLTHDLLTYTRAARSNLAPEAVDLDEQIQEILESYQSLKTWHRSIRVRQPLGRVLAHPPSLIQVLSNLLENAVKFSKPGELPDIDIYSEDHRGECRVIIQDHGIGIDPAYFDKIFQMFERLDQSASDGTGIGLAIVKKAVERMGGSVGVSSTLGQGSSFWIQLPRPPQSVNR